MQISLVKQVYLSLWADKTRSFLALLGVMIGVAAVVALVSSGEMASKSAVDKLKSMGSNLLAISVYSSNRGVEGFLDNEINALAKVFGVEKIALNFTASANIGVMGKSFTGLIIGANPALYEIAKLKIANGRMLTAMDNGFYNCVIGAKLNESLQERGVFSVLGSMIAINNKYCQVIGVLKPWAPNFFILSDLNRGVIMPIETAKSIVGSNSTVRDLVFKIDANYQVLNAQTKLLSIISQWKPDAHISVRNPEEIIQQIESHQQNFTLLLGLIGGVSLLVGGIGIMNVMLASLAERKYEIGLRMALGANSNDIRIMFLLESLVLSVVGGVLGIVFGLGGAFAIALFSDWSYTLFVAPIMLGFFVACLVGVFFGFYPAYRASLLDPIVVLRGLD